MRKTNSKLLFQAEAKLLQAQSMASIALKNHNYKFEGYDEPFIEPKGTGDLLWLIGDLIEGALTGLQQIEIKEEIK